MAQDTKYSRVRVGRPAGSERPGSEPFATLSLLLTYLTLPYLTYGNFAASLPANGHKPGAHGPTWRPWAKILNIRGCAWESKVP